MPATDGKMQVLPMHASSIVLLKRGELFCDHTSIKIESGVARIYNEEVIIYSPEIKRTGSRIIEEKTPPGWPGSAQ